MAELFQLRPVQQRALDGLRASLLAGRKRPQLELATGSGKTVIAAHIVAGALAKRKRVAFVAPLITLIDQTFERFQENGIAPGLMGVVQARHAWRRPHAPVQICSAQTIGRRARPEVDLVVVDESHLQYRAVHDWMAESPDRIFIGLSATPWARGMAEHWDDLVRPSTLKELIEAGDLCPLRAFAPAKPDLSGVKIVAGDYHEGQLSEVMSRNQIVGDVVQTWCEKGEDRPTLVFAVDRGHAAALHERFSSVGIASAYVDGETPLEDRRGLIRRFHAGEVRVICSIGTMNAGVDMDVRCIVFARPTKSEMLYVQSVGRGLRRAPDKDHLLLFDHSNTTLELGLPTDISFDRLRSGKPGKSSTEIAVGERPVRRPCECPSCGEIWPFGSRACGRCGFGFRRSNRVQELDGELVELSRRAALEERKRVGVWDMAAKARFFGELKLICSRRGYKEGWAAQKYRDRLGVWPDHSIRDAAPKEVSTDTASWLRAEQIRWAKRREKERAHERA